MVNSRQLQYSNTLESATIIV